MPTVEVNLSDLENLIGQKLPREIGELDQTLGYIKGEVESLEDDSLILEIKDSNHPDLWSTEGIARALKGFLGVNTGIIRYEVSGDSTVRISVNEKLKEIRPFIACAIVKETEISDDVIKGMMHLQDKLDQTYGRGRRRTSIGLYDYKLITPPINYSISKPEETSFTPLGFEEEMSLKEILNKHPKGIEYGWIVKPFTVWPILKDSEDKVLSFPPIINSNDLGRITLDTSDILIEVTGTTLLTVLDTLTIIAVSLADRGGKVYYTEITYPYGDMGALRTPQFDTAFFDIPIDYVEKILGLTLTRKEIEELIIRARYGILSADGDGFKVEVPCYRKDVIHPIDIVEDIAIAYDLNKIATRWPPQQTFGDLSIKTRYTDKIRGIMVGYGFQEILTFSMSNKEKLFKKMNLPEMDVVEVANPKMLTNTCLRTWLLPGLMEFLSDNTHVEYPQKIFEVGDCVLLETSASVQSDGTSERRKAACTLSHPKANYTEMKAILDSMAVNLNIAHTISPIDHDSFIEGRVGGIESNGSHLGIIGEVHPKVLESWNVEMPTTALELDFTHLV